MCGVQIEVVRSVLCTKELYVKTAFFLHLQNPQQRIRKKTQVPCEPNCVVKTYLSWIADADYDWPPKCPICNRTVGADASSILRLPCYCTYHRNCLQKHFISQLKPDPNNVAILSCVNCKAESCPPMPAKNLLHDHVASFIDDCKSGAIEQNNRVEVDEDEGYEISGPTTGMTARTRAETQTSVTIETTPGKKTASKKKPNRFGPNQNKFRIDKLLLFCLLLILVMAPLMYFYLAIYKGKTPEGESAGAVASKDV